MKKFLALIAGLLMVAGTLAACSTEADTVNKNLDREAEAFKVLREITFYNGITDKEMVRIFGYCNIEYEDRKIDVTCKEDGQFYRNTLTRADNAFVVSKQIEKSSVSDTHYKFVIRPGTLIPDLDLNQIDSRPGGGKPEGTDAP